MSCRYYPTAFEYGELLRSAGFEVNWTATVPRPTVLPTDMHGWLETFATGILSHIPEAQRSEAVLNVVENLKPALQDSKGTWTADYVRLRVHATKA